MPGLEIQSMDVQSSFDGIRIEAAGPTAGPWQIRTNLSLENLAFQNKDGSLMGERLSLTTRTQGVVHLKGSTITFAAALEVKGGEALYDRYYVNLAKNPLVSSCSGACRVDEKFLRFSGMTLNLTDILPLEIKGSLNRARPEIRNGCKMPISRRPFLRFP